MLNCIISQNCEHKFEDTARDPRFTFYGNVQIGGEISPSTANSSSSSSATIVPNLSSSPYAAQISLSALSPYYDAIILTYGASLDRSLNIPGETTLANVMSARSFVNWYNGHPNHSSLLSPLIDLSKIEHVTIIGQGNVALDVARLLLKPVDDLKETDLPDYALAELSRSKVKRVEIVGRRGPLQLACTTKELREMMALPGVGFEMDADLLRGAQEEVEKNPEMAQGRMRKRALGLLKTGSAAKGSAVEKSWKFDFLKSPTKLLSSEADMFEGIVGSQSASLPSSGLPAKVSCIDFDLNELVAPSSYNGDPTTMQARSTGRKVTGKTDLVMKSVGYRSIGIPGVPFDERRGVISNEGGRVTSKDGSIVRIFLLKLAVISSLKSSSSS